MSAINVNSITGRTGSHGPVLTGVTTISGDLHVGSGLSVTGISTLSNTIVGGGLSVTGISTLSNTVVGGATTELVVGGDARITGILTIGTGSVTIDGTSGSSSITGVTTAGIGSVYGVDSINDLGYPTAGPLSNRNLIINGAMVASQRGTSHTSQHTVNNYGIDRWQVVCPNTSAVLVHSQETTGGPDGFKNWLKISPSTADTDIAANDYSSVQQKIEGYNFAPARYGFADAKNVTVSFKFKTNKAGTYCMCHRNAAADRNYLHEFTPVADGSWQTITYTVTPDTSGTWDTTNAIGWRFELFLANGTANQSNTTDTWFGGQYFHATSNQVNFLDSTSNELGITGVQVELGTRATPFEHRSYGDELEKCRRYFQHSFTGAPSTTNTDHTGIIHAGGGNTSSTTGFLGTAMVRFSPNMRTTPTTVAYDLASPRNINKCHRHIYGVAGTNNQSITMSDINDKGFAVRSDSGVSATGIIFHYTAEAEL
ncbi:putative carbohydrate binding domain containing protein [Synechococcus phage S-B43]|nr:putative carbohydrate binding domain containing protein [Synechococcus phage S-B43]